MNLRGNRWRLKRRKRFTWQDEADLIAWDLGCTRLVEPELGYVLWNYTAFGVGPSDYVRRQLREYMADPDATIARLDSELMSS